MASAILSCSICTEEFDDSQDLCSTVCGHIFHFSCLQQWQERSNTCPLCNQRSPQPHRLFIDLSGFSKTDTKQDEDNDNKIVIKGIKSQLMSTPLSSFVLDLASTMGISIREADIKDIVKSQGNLYVTFFSVKHLNLFMENKNKLKGNQKTSDIKINEVLDTKSEELFRYAHKLKQFGYGILFVKNKKIYAKMNQRDAPLNINSIEQVDLLCSDKTSVDSSQKCTVNNTTKTGPNKTRAFQSDRTKKTAVPPKKQPERNQQRHRVRPNNSTSSSSRNQNPNYRRSSSGLQNTSTALNNSSVPNSGNQRSCSGSQYSREWRNPSAPVSSVYNPPQATAPDYSDLFQQLLLVENANSMPVDGGTNFRQSSYDGWIMPPIPPQSTEKKHFGDKIFSLFKKITETFKKN